MRVAPPRLEARDKSCMTTLLRVRPLGDTLLGRPAGPADRDDLKPRNVGSASKATPEPGPESTEKPNRSKGAKGAREGPSAESGQRVEDAPLREGVHLEGDGEALAGHRTAHAGERLVVLEVREGRDPPADELVRGDGRLPGGEVLGHVHVEVGREALRVLPVVGVVDAADAPVPRVRRLEPLERREQHGRVHDAVRRGVVRVEARLPVGDDVRRLHLPDDVGHEPRRLLGVAQLAVLPGAEERLGPEDLRRDERLPLLLLAVGGRAHLRVAALAEREVQHHHPVTEPLVAGQDRAGRDLGVAGVGADREHRAVAGRAAGRGEGEAARAAARMCALRRVLGHGPAF